jgi:hypothetical protein
MHGTDGADRGIIPRVIENVFENINSPDSKNKEHVDISMSCIEIYQEKLIDLLLPSSSSGPGVTQNALRIRQHPGGEVWVEVSTSRQFNNSRQ